MKLFDSDQTAVSTIQNVNPTQPSNPTQPADPNPSGDGSGGGTTTGADNGGGTGGFGNASTYTITLQDGVEHGTISCSARAAEGDTVSLTALPDSDYKLGALTVTADDNTVVATSGTGNARTFLMPAKNVIVRVLFRTIPASGVYTELPVGTDGTAGTNWTYVTFGLWPQTVQPKKAGADGEKYWSKKESKYDYGGQVYYYSDGTKVLTSGSNSYRNFKVEPIKWRVLTTNYNGTGKKLLLAENILFTAWYYWPSNTGHPSINTFLSEFYDKAFSDAEKAKISNTTKGNVFLLTRQEVNSMEYGFSSNSDRLRIATDYAKADYLQMLMPDYAGCWWLKDLNFSTELTHCPPCVVFSGSIGTHTYLNGQDGVVPAILVEN